MNEAWVVNASPVIILAKANRLDILDETGVDVVVPEAVAGEILAGPIEDPARLVIQAGWGKRVAVESIPDEVLEWSLGPGESAVIATVLQLGSGVAVLDDAKARACARVLGVSVMGTLGLVLRAKRKGRIESAARVISSLRRVGLFLDNDVVKKALKSTTGEEWPT